MPRPSRPDLRQLIILRRAALEADNPLVPISELNQMLADEISVPEYTVRYYMRTAGESDRRGRYTEAERMRLCSMNRRELEIYAKKSGKNLNTLYAMVWRYNHRQDHTEERIIDTVALCEARGFLNFARQKELKAFGLPGAAFKDARKIVVNIQGLDLLAPNFLIHKQSDKFYPLTSAEQVALLKAPKRFLKDRAPWITTHWLSSSGAQGYFTLYDASAYSPETNCEGVVISNHGTFEEAAKAKRALASTQPKLQTRILKSLGDPREAFSRHAIGSHVFSGPVPIHIIGDVAPNGEIVHHAPSPIPPEGLALFRPLNGPNDTISFVPEVPPERASGKKNSTDHDPMDVDLQRREEAATKREMEEAQLREERERELEEASEEKFRNDWEEWENN